jgi:transcriptional regulator with XRE-family HTH domain
MISSMTKTTLSMLGQLIKTARQQRNMSQMDLAERLGVSRQTLISIEKGNHQVSAGTLFEAAHIVGIPLLSDDKKTLTQWQAILAGFTALLPARTHSKKVEINDDF